MNFKIILNDFAKSKFITLATTIFIAAATLLVSLAAILAVNLTGAIDAMMQQAETPHFMQMHSGEIDITRLTNFANQEDGVDEFQVLEFLNIDNSKIQLGENSLSRNTQDNGFSVQSETFDYLLDLDGNIIHANDGELYVPICYMRDNTTKVGDKAIVSGKEYTVAGFLRDSQMNSMLSSSKRFLVSKSDFASLKNLGNMEYLIEFRLKNISELSSFGMAYTAKGLPANGPTITYPLFKMLNAMSDGMMIGVILLISILVVTIALLCVRFTLLAKIEDEIKEIGVMKAIGLRISDIKQIFLAKYAAIGVIGCILGFALSFAFRGMLTQNIRLTMGESTNASIANVLAMVLVLLIFFVIILFVNGILRNFQKISAIEAIRFGTNHAKHAVAKNFSLSKNKLFDTNVFLGIKDVLARKGLYATMLVVLVLATFIMIVPQNLYSTISAKSFATYMGIGNCDMRIDIQQIDDISEKATQVADMMGSDKYISKYTVLATKAFKVKLADGSVESMKIELGDHSVFPVYYSKGKSPTTSDEIALSVINADELNKKVGEVITLITDEGEKTLTICGIYSDITNGGKTAKAVFPDNSTDIIWSIIYASLTSQSAIENTSLRYSNQFAFAKVTDTQEYISQTYGQTLISVKQASIAAIAVSLIIIVLVTSLFMKMLVVKDRYSIAVMKACGFTNADIRLQYISRSAFVLLLGIIIGTFLANTVGEMIAGVVISSFGASSFRFTPAPLLAYLLYPLIMVCAVFTATFFSTSTADVIKISENIKE